MSATPESTPAVVVGVDGSESSRRALEWGLEEARLRNLPLEVVTTWEYPTNYGITAWPEGLDLAGDAARVQAETIGSVLGSTTQPGVVTTVAEGHAAWVLTQRSASAALLVVGSRGHGGFAGLLLGSVSGHLAAHSQCPVLIVHATSRP